MISGGDGNDVLRGGSGDDRISGGAGANRAWGGRGADTYLTLDGQGRLLDAGSTDKSGVEPVIVGEPVNPALVGIALTPRTGEDLTLGRPGGGGSVTSGGGSLPTTNPVTGTGAGSATDLTISNGLVVRPRESVILPAGPVGPVPVADPTVPPVPTDGGGLLDPTGVVVQTTINGGAQLDGACPSKTSQSSPKNTRLPAKQPATSPTTATSASRTPRGCPRTTTRLRPPKSAAPAPNG